MPTRLENFKKSIGNFNQYRINLISGLTESHPDLVNRVLRESCNFLEAPWTELDDKTLSSFKLMSIFSKIDHKIVSLLYPIGAIFSFAELNARALNPTQVLHAIKEIAEDARQETLNNNSGFEVIVDFLKSCMNFLISMVTGGKEPSFFKTSTSYLEPLYTIQQEINTIFDELNAEEKMTECVSGPRISLY